MKNKCRNIVAGVVLAMLLLPILTMGILQVAEAYIESTREERLEAENLVLVTLPVQEVIWEENRKELWVGDKLFDVSSFTIKGNVYHLIGVFDEEETEVAEFLLHIISSKKGNDFLHLLLLLQCFSIAVLSFPSGYQKLLQTKDKSVYFFWLPFPSYLVLVPPPRQISFPI